MAPVVHLMFELFKDEADNWNQSRIIELDGFLVDYMRFGSHLELSFCDPDRTQFAFIAWRIKFDRYNYWTKSVEPPRSSCSYSEFFDWMAENKPKVAEWLLFNAI